MSFGPPLTRWNSIFTLPDSYLGQELLPFTANVNVGGPVAFGLPSLPSLPDLIPIQLPNPAINDIQIETISADIGITVFENLESSDPAPGIVTGSLLLARRNEGFLTIPLDDVAWGTTPPTGTATYKMSGEVTPQTPIRLYQSDTFQLSVLCSIPFPVPQYNGATSPTSYVFVNIAEGSTINMIGSLVAKGSLF